MSGIVPYLIWAVLIVSGLGFVMMLGFGLRNLAQGKVNPITVVVLGIPAVVIGILGMVLDSWGEACIYGVLGLLVLASLSLLLSSFRMMFGL